MPKDPRLVKNKLAGFNKPKRTPSHPTKSHPIHNERIFCEKYSERKGKN